MLLGGGRLIKSVPSRLEIFDDNRGLLQLIFTVFISTVLVVFLRLSLSFFMESYGVLEQARFFFVRASISR